MNTLEKIFGGASRIKIMRLFLFNPNNVYDASDVKTRAKVKPEIVRREIAMLSGIKLLKSKVFYKNVERGKGKGRKTTKKKILGWTLSENFPYLIPLQNFLIHINPMRHDEIIKKLNGVGRIKLLIISGVFIQELESRVDLLIVGDHLKKGNIDSIVRVIESEIGKELKYTTFSTVDFQYRLGMCDKLIRDILDYPHEKVIDKLGIA